MSTTDSSTVNTALSATNKRDEGADQVLGRYKLLEKLGEGGFGVVWLAEQKEPVRRKVAFKIIKLGMDTRAVVARFEAERQALALMDHPNIAKVLDAGATETGRPFFVMELVRGIRITDYCDQNHLNTRERLDLFIKVCQAIQHAHQKGIIHRDIKPSNILVTLHDGVPVPKVIDFGIAKPTQGELTDKTVHTQFQQFIGTPAYMSPEQAEMSGLDVDTRADIYSLGVLLYELLTGKTPFDAAELMSQGIDAMRKIIREKDPLRPSTRLATLHGEERTTTAKRHALEIPRLIHQLKGDLDWIVMKCLEKDRTRRYETANGLAADLKRHLNNETVIARPPSSAYRFQKMVRRNQVAFAALSAIMAALFLGTVVSAWQAVRAKRAEALALQSRDDAEKLADFMLEDFYAELEPSGRFETVARLARQAVAYYDSLPGSLRSPASERNRALAQARLALIVAQQGNSNDALPVSSAAVSGFERMRELGDRGEETLFGHGLALFAQFWCYRARMDLASMSPPLEKCVALLKPSATSREGSRRIKLLCADALDQLGHLQPIEQGLGLSQEARRILADLGALDLSDLTAASAWADSADSEARGDLILGRLEEAEKLEKQTKMLAEGVLARRPADLRAMRDLSEAADVLATVAARRFHLAEAVELGNQSQRAAEDYVRFNPSEDLGWFQFSKRSFANASLAFQVGNIAEGLRKARAAVAWRLDESATNAVPDMTYNLRGAIAAIEAQHGNRAAAEESLDEAIRTLSAYQSRVGVSDVMRVFQDDRIDSFAFEVKIALGEDSVAYEIARKSLARLETIREEAHRRRGSTQARNWLLREGRVLAESARAALKLGRYQEAEAAARACLALGESDDDATIDPVQLKDPVWAQVLLAEALLNQNRQEEALKAVESALQHYRQLQVQGASAVVFRHHFARALYVQAMVEPADPNGAARRRDELSEARKVIEDLSVEAQQLHDTKELLSLIGKAQHGR